MLRSFALVLATGTIVVQCTSQKPKLAQRRETRNIAQPVEISTPTNTPPVKGNTNISPSAGREGQILATTAPKISTHKLPDCIKTKCSCRNFAHQKEAQTVLEAFPNDPYRLDRNKNGVACESLPK